MNGVSCGTSVCVICLIVPLDRGRGRHANDPPASLNVLLIWKRSPGISPPCARACLGSPFETSESHGPDLCVAYGFLPTLSGPVLPTV